jgi:hypothetical protein
MDWPRSSARKWQTISIDNAGGLEMLQNSKKCLVLAIIAAGVVALPVMGYGASVALVAGANATKVSNSNKTRSYTSDSLLGYGAGAFVEFRPWMSLGAIGTETGLLYSHRAIGYGTAATETSAWLELPVLLRVHMAGLSLGAGGYLARALGNIKASVRNLDYGYTGALSYSFASSAFVDLRYNGDLRNLAKDDGVTYKFTEMQLLLGYHF